MLSTWFGSGIAILNTSEANICASFTNSINSEVLKSDVPRFSWNTSPSKTLSCKITESPYFWIIRSVISWCVCSLFRAIPASLKQSWKIGTITPHQYAFCSLDRFLRHLSMVMLTSRPSCCLNAASSSGLFLRTWPPSIEHFISIFLTIPRECIRSYHRRVNRSSCNGLMRYLRCPAPRRWYSPCTLTRCCRSRCKRSG